MEEKYVLLPANDAVQNWFEENVDKECSASSAVYKFRQWLESLQVKRQAEAVWVKASERLPPTGLIVWRWLDKTEAYTGYKEKGGFHFGTGGARVDPTYYSEIEWLDESSPAAREEDAVAFAEWILKEGWNNNISMWSNGIYSIEGGKNYSTAKLYRLFKQQKDK